MEPHLSSNDVVAAITEAFPPLPLEPELAFAETVYLDAERFRSEARGKVWSELSEAFLELHHDAISFLAPVAFAAFVPAYLAATVAPSDDIDVLPVSLLRTLTRSEDSRQMFDERLRQLTPQQQLAVAHALEYLVGSLDEGLWKRSARRALASYWRQLLERR